MTAETITKPLITIEADAEPGASYNFSIYAFTHPDDAIKDTVEKRILKLNSLILAGQSFLEELLIH